MRPSTGTVHVMMLRKGKKNAAAVVIEFSPKRTHASALHDTSFRHSSDGSPPNITVKWNNWPTTITTEPYIMVPVTTASQFQLQNMSLESRRAIKTPNTEGTKVHRPSWVKKTWFLTSLKSSMLWWSLNSSGPKVTIELNNVHTATNVDPRSIHRRRSSSNPRLNNCSSHASGNLKSKAFRRLVNLSRYAWSTSATRVSGTQGRGRISSSFWVGMLAGRGGETHPRARA
mmetsp:Transcript_106197/g.305343  ORF Transcript_106197/g.305343 Transcript_106197/m.305343 type:complete len:229 (+) Transcript_106197:181-867(+)